MKYILYTDYSIRNNKHTAGYRILSMNQVVDEGSIELREKIRNSAQGELVAIMHGLSKIPAKPWDSIVCKTDCNSVSHVINNPKPRHGTIANLCSRGVKILRRSGLNISIKLLTGKDQHHNWCHSAARSLNKKV